MLYEKQLFLEFKQVYRQKQLPEMSGLVLIANRMKTIGIFPPNDRPTFTYRAISWLIVAFLSLVVITEAWGISTVLDDFVEAVCTFTEMVTLAMIVFKIQHYQRHYEEIVELGRAIDRDFVRGCQPLRGEQKEQMRKSFIEFYIIIPALGYVFCINLMLTVVIMPAFYTDKLPFVASYPWNPYGSKKAFCGTYIIQGFAYSFGMILMSQIEAYGIGLFHYMDSLFEMLSDKMKVLEGTRENLVKLIHEHQHLIELADKVNGIFQPLYMAQVVVSLMLICLSGFQMAVALSIGDIPVFQRFYTYWSVAFSQIAFWCYNGNKTYWRSQEMFLSLIESNWYEMPLDVQKDLVLLLQRTQKPIEFRAGVICPYNFDTLIFIINKSYSVFALLMKVLEQ